MKRSGKKRGRVILEIESYISFKILRHQIKIYTYI